MTEREQFEAWAKVRYAKNPHFWLRQIDDGGYSCGMADSAWDAWQAARAQPAQAVPVLTDDALWELWNAQGCDDMNQAEAMAFARRVEQAVLAKMGVSQWLPIETAPIGAWGEPRKWVLIYCVPGEFREHEKPIVVVAYRSAGVTGYPYFGTVHGAIDPCIHTPTHWMPLPPPPGIVGKEGA